MAENDVILIVEDNPLILDINCRILEKEGYMVHAAKTLKEAREHLKNITFDLAVLDIMLPDGSGLDFLAELRNTCDAPVLFLTAKTERKDIIAGLAAGGNDYITKPYDIDEFRLRITGLLRLVKSASTKNQPNSSLQLSEKERQIMYLAAKGLRNKEIAQRVYLSESRVKTCLSKIYKELGIANNKNKRRLLWSR